MTNKKITLDTDQLNAMIAQAVAAATGSNGKAAKADKPVTVAFYTYTGKKVAGKSETKPSDLAAFQAALAPGAAALVYAHPSNARRGVSSAAFRAVVEALGYTLS